MWLITTLIAALVATLAWRLIPEKKYRLDALAVMLWGLELMIIIDHVLGYEGGAFIEMQTDGLVTNATLLGAMMLIPVLAAWLIYVMLANRKENEVRSV